MRWPTYTGATIPVHPRTALWFKQREQCDRCRHTATRAHRKGNGTTVSSGGGSMACVLGRGPDQSCMSMRDAGSRCGPDARLFEAIR